MPLTLQAKMVKLPNNFNRTRLFLLNKNGLEGARTKLGWRYTSPSDNRQGRWLTRTCKSVRLATAKVVADL